jgi:tRNA(adenine34) deaminase
MAKKSSGAARRRKTHRSSQKIPRRSNARSHTKGTDRRWLSKVKAVSTFPPKDVFTKDAETLAKTMASKKVSPKGLGSAVRMVQFFINRAGKNLAASRKRELERAKRILQNMKANKKSKSRETN